jgi:hypothetical protein
VGSALDLAPQVLERIAQVEPRYFEQARQGVLEALRRWDDDYAVPACLDCGSPRVDWVEALALYRCQDRGAEEKIGLGKWEGRLDMLRRRAPLRRHTRPRPNADRSAWVDGEGKTATCTGATASDALIPKVKRIDELTTHERKEQNHG